MTREEFRDYIHGTCRFVKGNNCGGQCESLGCLSALWLAIERGNKDAEVVTALRGWLADDVSWVTCAKTIKELVLHRSIGMTEKEQKDWVDLDEALRRKVAAEARAEKLARVVAEVKEWCVKSKNDDDTRYRDAAYDMAAVILRAEVAK